jgi:hypothetical protein
MLRAVVFIGLLIPLCMPESFTDSGLLTLPIVDAFNIPIVPAWLRLLCLLPGLDDTWFGNVPVWLPRIVPLVVVVDISVVIPL